MIGKTIHIAVMTALFVAATVPVAFAQPAGTLTAAEVVALGPAGDGRTITLIGEAIGDSLRAERGYRWINVLSDGVAVGVWLPSGEAARVKVLGDYRATGDIVQATGTFNYACDKHGGDLDIHATQFRVIKKGQPRPRSVDVRDVVFAGIATIGAIAQVWFYRRKQRLPS